MKRENLIIVTSMALGALSGLLTALILMAVGSPSLGDSVLTLNEKTDFDRLAIIGAAVSRWSSSTVVMTVAVLLGLVSFSLFLGIINPRVTGAFRSKTGILKAALVLLACLILFGAAEYAADALFLLPLIMGLLWFLAGETGWAGDFSSWRMNGGEKRAHLETPLLGCAFGVALWAGISFFQWAGEKYFLLVSEVLDGTGEVSLLGFKMLAWGLIAAFTIGTGMASASAVALSPTYRTAGERLRLAAFPLVLSVATILVVGAAYLFFSDKYDLNKTTLAEAAGITVQAPLNKTVVLLKTSEVKPQNWQLRATTTAGFFPAGSIDVSYDNLKKIETYLEMRREGSVFTYAALETLATGYYALWDVPRASEWQYRSSPEMLLPRLMLLSKLAALPVAGKNLEYLKSLSDEGKWHIGPKYALKIAEAYGHFGMTDEAAAWREKARQRGADPSKSVFERTALSDGVIEGGVFINGKRPSNVRVGLFQDSGALDKIETWTFSRTLLDAKDLDASGRFKFDRLGSGEYLLGIMTDQGLVPSGSDIKVVNSPGAIKLTPGRGERHLKEIRVFVE